MLFNNIHGLTSRMCTVFTKIINYKGNYKVKLVINYPTRITRSFVQLILALFFVVSFSSCNLKVTELAKTYVKTATFNQCVENFSTNMTKYFAAKISTKEFQDFWLCFSKSIDIFASTVKGKETDKLTADEIIFYISKLLKTPPVISKNLSKEIILFKQWLVGGNDTITKAELKQISKTLKEITPFLLKLLESMEIYNLFSHEDSAQNILSKYSWKEVEARLETAKTSLAEFFEIINTYSPKTSYSYAQLKDISLHIGWFLNNGAENTFSKFLTTQENFFQAAQILLSPNGPTVKFSPKRWKESLRLFFDWYPLSLQYELTMQGQGLFHVEKLNYLLLLINDTFKFSSALVEGQPQKTISYSRLLSIFEKLNEYFLLPFKVDEKLLSVFIGKFFTPEADRQSVSGLSIQSLRRIKEVADQWAKAQVLLSGGDNQKFFLQQSIKKSANKKSANKKSANNVKYYERLLKMAEKNIYFFKSPGISIPFDHAVSKKTNTYNLFIYNNLLSLVERIFYAYSLNGTKTTDTSKANLSITDAELTPSEITALTKDIFILLNSFGIVIPVDVESASSLVAVLSQFFSYNSRGAVIETKTEPCSNFYCEEDESGKSVRQLVSERVSFEEIFEFFSIIYSAINKAKKEFVILKEECSQDCVKNFFNKVETDSGFSVLNNYFIKTSKASKKEFFSLLYENIFDQKQNLTEDKLFLTYFLLHFIEAVIKKYDKDNSGILDKNELEQALVVFEGLVIKLLEKPGSGVDTKSIQQTFHFVLTMPLDANAWDKIQFIFDPPVLQADPLSIFRILSVIIFSED